MQETSFEPFKITGSRKLKPSERKAGDEMVKRSIKLRSKNTKKTANAN